MTRLDLLDWADVAAIGVVARLHYPADYPRLVHRSLVRSRWDDHRRIVADALRSAYEAVSAKVGPGEAHMANVQDVARYFLRLSQPDEGDFVSNLKLQKLVYYAQGFHLAIFGRPLFDAQIHAWEHGPVVDSLYHQYKGHGSAAIPCPDAFDSEAVLTAEERSLLDDVWDAYGQFSAWKLRNMTHDEPPWKDTPRGFVIDHETMREYFSTLLRS